MTTSKRSNAPPAPLHARGGTTALGDRARYRPTAAWIDNPAGHGPGRVWANRSIRPAADALTGTAVERVREDR